MTPEQQILRDVVDRIAVLRGSLDEVFAALGPLPQSDAEFAAMTSMQRIASTAALKVVEQLEDALVRLFKTILRVLAVDTGELMARDISDHMHRLGIVADAEGWVEIVKLRNRLAHEYPMRADKRLARLTEAHAAAAVLRETTARATAFLSHRGLL